MEFSFDIFHIKQEFDKLVRDLDVISTIYQYVVLALYVFFQVYCLIFQTGFLVINAILLALSVLYLGVFTFCVVRKTQGKAEKRVDKIARNIYKWSKFAAVLVSAVLSIIGIVIAVEEVTPFRLAMAIALPVALVLQVVLEIIIYWAKFKIKCFETALKYDFELVKKNAFPVIGQIVKNFFFKRKTMFQGLQVEELTDEEVARLATTPASPEKHGQTPSTAQEVAVAEEQSKKRGALGFFKRLFSKKDRGTDESSGQEGK